MQDRDHGETWVGAVFAFCFIPSRSRAGTHPFGERSNSKKQKPRLQSPISIPAREHRHPCRRVWTAENAPARMPALPGYFPLLTAHSRASRITCAAWVSVMASDRVGRKSFARTVFWKLAQMIRRPACLGVSCQGFFTSCKRSPSSFFTF